MPNHWLAEAVKRLRGDMSLRDLGDKLGISASTLQRVDAGKNITVEHYQKLCEWVINQRPAPVRMVELTSARDIRWDTPASRGYLASLWRRLEAEAMCSADTNDRTRTQLSLAIMEFAEASDILTLEMRTEQSDANPCHSIFTALPTAAHRAYLIAKGRDPYATTN